jgi:DNA repair exonuclease SbcCD ATPase subunit
MQGRRCGGNTLGRIVSARPGGSKVIKSPTIAEDAGERVTTVLKLLVFGSGTRRAGSNPARPCKIFHVKYREEVITMRLMSLTLNNFKGIRSFSLEPQGKDTNIYGDNATGKTTLADAFMWLLFDKDSQGKTNFEIKTLDKDGQPIHGLDHEVEAVLEVEGKKITLRKVYAEKWTKKKGAAKKVFTGHTTNYYVDDVPVKKKDYLDRIASIVNEDVFKLLTSPTYFNEQLHWQDRRRILLEVVGDVSDNEVISSSKELAKLPSILNGHDLEEFKKIIFNQRAKVNKELDRIPIRIDEVQSSLPDTSYINPQELESDIKKAKDAISEKHAEVQRLESGGEIAEKKKRLSEIETEIMAIDQEQRREYEEMVTPKQKELYAARGVRMQLEDTIKSLEQSINTSSETVKRHEKTMQNLRNKWHEINAEKFEHEDMEICPTCGQFIPQEQINEAKRKAFDAFNLNKAKRLEEIQKEGKQQKLQADELKVEIEDAKTELETAKSKLIEQDKTIEAISAEIERLQELSFKPSDNQEKQQKLQEKQKVTDDIASINSNLQGQIDDAKAELRQLEVALSTLEEGKYMLEQHEKGLKRIDELKAQEEKLAAEFERLEHELYLTEQFTKTKVKMLDEKINGKFKLARFKMFDEQVNGGITECCETMHQGVPYGSMNNAARINIGLDIINTLSEHFGFAPPVWLDNAESVVNILPTRGQQIRLIVSEKDKKLRVETSALKEAI